MKYDSDILIVGGGLNGPALALALAGGGLSVTVIDARPAVRRALKVLADVHTAPIDDKQRDIMFGASQFTKR